MYNVAAKAVYQFPVGRLAGACIWPCFIEVGIASQITAVIKHRQDFIGIGHVATVIPIIEVKLHQCVATNDLGYTQ